MLIADGDVMKRSGTVTVMFIESGDATDGTVIEFSHVGSLLAPLVIPPRCPSGRSYNDDLLMGKIGRPR